MKSPMVSNADYVENKDRYSELQVMQSAAGFYVGTVYNSPEGYPEPGSRDSEYFASHEEAEKYLREVVEGEADTRMRP